jgi:hypothetical protein
MIGFSATEEVGASKQRNMLEGKSVPSFAKTFSPQSFDAFGKVVNPMRPFSPKFTLQIGSEDPANTRGKERFWK